MLYFDILYLCVALLPKNCDDRGTSRGGVDNQDNIGVSMCSLWKGVEMRLRRERRAWRGMRLQTGFCVFVACGLALGTTSCDDWYWDSSIYDGLMQNFDIETNRETGKSTVAQQARISYDGSCSLPESLAENWLRCTPIENNGQLETCEPASLRDLIVLRFNDYSYIRDKKAEDGNASNDDADRTGTQAPMAQPQNEKQGFIVETYCALWSGVEGLPPVCEKNGNDQTSASAPAGGKGEATRLLCKKIGHRIVVDGVRTDCADAEDEAAKALCRLYKDESNEAFIHAFNYRACPKNYNYREAYVVTPTQENSDATRYRNVCVQASCNGELVDLLFDNANCGVCSNTCGGEAFCENGICTKCKGGMEECAGVCIDFKANHILKCHGNNMICQNDYADVDGKVGNGCEFNMSSVHVAQYDYSTKSFHCVDGFCDSDGDLINGCEYNMVLNHVKECKTNELICEAPYAICDKSNKTCGVNLNTDVNHCGNCDKKCSDSIISNSNVKEYACERGECKVKTCVDGFYPSSNKTKCEQTGDTENCGVIGYDCAHYVKGWKNGVCIEDICVATECKPEGYLLDNSGMCLYTKCDTDSECSGATNKCLEHVCVCHSENASTKDNDRICQGERPFCHGIDGCKQCISDEHCVVANAIGKCERGMCTFECSDGYHAVYANQIFTGCEENTNDNCGKHGFSCREGGNRFCNKYMGECVQCLTDSDCSNDCVYKTVCTTSNKCVDLSCNYGYYMSRYNQCTYLWRGKYYNCR